MKVGVRSRHNRGMKIKSTPSNAGSNSSLTREELRKLPVVELVDLIIKRDTYMRELARELKDLEARELALADATARAAPDAVE